MDGEDVQVRDSLDFDDSPKAFDGTRLGSDDDMAEHDEYNLQSSILADEDPKVGMEFNTTGEAYNYYNRYARVVGFSVRKRRTNKSKSAADQKKILRYTLCCSCEGTYTKIKTPIKKRDERRFNCKAEFVVKLNKRGKYELVKFTAEHTHEVVAAKSAHLMRSQRGVMSSQADYFSKMYSSGIRQSGIFNYFSEEVGGAEYLNFTRTDLNNFFQRQRAKIHKRGDALSLLDYFRAKKEENKHFYYSIRTNDDNEICGVFFCDGLSRRDYALFGDIMSFDTTFRTNDYNMLCAPFVGVNNHGQTTIFGCGLIERETTESFTWLFNTFLKAMGGKKPEAIFSDQDMAISNAISDVFPGVHHGLYLWHIYNNALTNLNHMFRKCNYEFNRRFRECIYEGETIEEFLDTWADFLKDFNLEDNKWLQGLYKLREKWAQVYAHSIFVQV